MPDMGKVLAGEQHPVERETRYSACKLGDSLVNELPL